MRSLFSVIFLLLVTALLSCAVAARRSHKSIGVQVSTLLFSLVPPVLGNLLIIVSGEQLLSTVGCYIYFLGMDFVMYALLRFTFSYCNINWPSRWLRNLVYGLLILDILQYAVNPFLGQAFTMEVTVLDGFDYYKFVPLAGQSLHRIVDYGIFFSTVVIFFFKMIRSPRVYSERYSAIFFCMVLAGLWQSFYIFSRTPIDRSMIGFGVFGLLVFYFALYYRPRRLLDRILATVASELPEALFFFDPNAQCIWANKPGIDLAKLEDDSFDEAPEKLRPLLGDWNPGVEEWSTKVETGFGSATRYYSLENRAVVEDNGRIAGSVLSIRDNTQEQRDLQKELYNANHDSLTGLYTRDYFYEQVRRKLQEKPDTDYLAIFVDVNDFKIVNDIFGTTFGDHALCQIAAWIRTGLSEDCVYGRFAGDTFGVLQPASEFNAERLEETLTHFKVTNGAVEHPILMHLGIYAVQNRGLDVSVMFDRARLALSTIKDQYQIHIAHYDDNMRKKVLWNQRISAELPQALAERQIRPWLQAIVNREGKVVGAEALVRWIHPETGFLSPAAFIPVFEENGMIAQVDKYMWRCACEILASWKETRPDLFISINISPRDFYFINVAEEIRSVVKEFDVDPSRLRIEVTESVMMTDVENRMRMLADLQSSGFIVEIDDFGSGYSSLNMLKDMPVDVLKIDMMFLSKSSHDDKAATILHNTIRMTDDLGISALTEGVETENQYQMLSGMGCKLFQGYYFAKPMPVDQFENFCTENRGEAAS